MVHRCEMNVEGGCWDIREGVLGRERKGKMSWSSFFFFFFFFFLRCL
jgi:hypothetical protein